jgi:glycosyltransferase involved in cell wall biosynthesis
MGRNGRAVATERFDWVRIAGLLERVYQEAAAL